VNDFRKKRVENGGDGLKPYKGAYPLYTQPIFIVRRDGKIA